MESPRGSAAVSSSAGDVHRSLSPHHGHIDAHGDLMAHSIRSHPSHHHGNGYGNDGFAVIKKPPLPIQDDSPSDIGSNGMPSLASSQQPLIRAPVVHMTLLNPPPMSSTPSGSVIAAEPVSLPPLMPRMIEAHNSEPDLLPLEELPAEQPPAVAAAAAAAAPHPHDHHHRVAFSPQPLSSQPLFAVPASAAAAPSLSSSLGSPSDHHHHEHKRVLQSGGGSVTTAGTMHSDIDDIGSDNGHGHHHNHHHTNNNNSERKLEMAILSQAASLTQPLTDRDHDNNELEGKMNGRNRFQTNGTATTNGNRPPPSHPRPAFGDVQVALSNLNGNSPITRQTSATSSNGYQPSVAAATNGNGLMSSNGRTVTATQSAASTVRAGQVAPAPTTTATANTTSTATATPTIAAKPLTIDMTHKDDDKHLKRRLWPLYASLLMGAFGIMGAFLLKSGLENEFCTLTPPYNTTSYAPNESCHCDDREKHLVAGSVLFSIGGMTQAISLFFLFCHNKPRRRDGKKTGGATAVRVGGAMVNVEPAVPSVEGQPHTVQRPPRCCCINMCGMDGTSSFSRWLSDWGSTCASPFHFERDWLHIFLGMVSLCFTTAGTSLIWSPPTCTLPGLPDSPCWCSQREVRIGAGSAMIAAALPLMILGSHWGRDLMQQRLVQATLRMISYKKALHAAAMQGLQPCVGCGSGIKPESKFCDNCGRPAAPSPQKGICSQCGTHNSHTAKFCLQCGTAIVNIAGANADPNNPLPPPPSFEFAVGILPPPPELLPC